MALSEAELDAYIQQRSDEEAANKQAAIQSMDMSKSVLSPDYRPRGALGGQEIGGLVGSVGGAIGGGILGGPAGAALGSTAGAGLGGALGETTEQLLRGESISPRRIAGAGAEEAAWDAAGNLVIKMGGKAFKLAADATFNRNAIPDAAQAADVWLKQYGSSLPEAAKTGTGFDKTLEGIAFTPATADLFVKKQGEIKAALDKGSKDILSSLTTSPEFAQAIKSTTSPQRAAGDVLQSFMKNGSESLSAAVKPIYADVFKDVDSRVSTFGIKQWADKLLSDPEALTSGQRSILKEVRDWPTQMDVPKLHEVRSRWLAENRDKFSSAGTEKDSRAVKTITSLIDQIDNAMDFSANKTLKGETLQKYRDVTKTYREGIQGMQSEAVDKALTLNPEEVGAYLFKSGNETPIAQLHKSIVAASRLSGKPSGEILDALRYGYLEGFVNTPENVLKFSKNLEQDVNFRNTYNMLFGGTPQNQAIKDMAAAAEKGLVGAKHLPGLNMRTAGAVLNIGAAPAAVATGYYFTLDPEQQQRLRDNFAEASFAGGAFLLSQRQLAKLMLNPQGAKAVSYLSKAKEKTMSPSGFTKLVVEPIANILGPEGERQSMFTPSSSAPLSNEDLDAYINKMK